MKTVTFAREYRYELPNHRTAIYPPNVEIEVSNEVAEAAERVGALKEEQHGKRPTAGN
jgi:hypothetical protein